MIANNLMDKNNTLRDESRNTKAPCADNINLEHGHKNIEVVTNVTNDNLIKLNT